jgi:hypothetical protein
MGSSASPDQRRISDATILRDWQLVLAGTIDKANVTIGAEIQPTEL